MLWFGHQWMRVSKGISYQKGRNLLVGAQDFNSGTMSKRGNETERGNKTPLPTMYLFCTKHI